jgi:hypothetical protein
MYPHSRTPPAPAAAPSRMIRVNRTCPIPRGRKAVTGAPAAEEKEQRTGVREAGGGVRLIEHCAGEPPGGGRWRGDEREEAPDPETERLEIGPQSAGQEGEAEGLAAVGGQEVATVGVDGGPDLIGHGQPDGDAELGVGDHATDAGRARCRRAAIGRAHRRL